MLPIEISARHIHLSEKDKDFLFGENYEFNKKKDLSQTGLFACEETITLIVNGKKLENIRVIGPFRPQTQIEISRTDAFALKIDPPIRLSGDLKNSPGGKIIGPQNSLEIPEGIIISKRHLHISPKEAENLNLQNGQKIRVKIPGERALIFDEIIVRIDENYTPALHIDTDEANAAGIVQGGKGEIIG